MRIALNAAIYDRRPSGLGIYARELAVALRALHDDLIVYTQRTDDLPFGRRISALGSPTRGRTGHLWRLGWTQTVLPARTRLDRADVLVNTLPEGPVVPLVPQVTVVHDILPLFFPRDFPRQQWYFRVFVPAVLRASAAVIADSVQTAQDLTRSYGLPSERITVVPPGVDTTRFYPRPDGAAVAARLGLQDYLLFVGNLRPHKNVVRLFEAFARLRPGLSLAVVGYRDPRYWPPIARRIADLGLGGRVKFLDFVPVDALPALYSAARAAVIPSLYEGFGLPVLEAMACGTAVVASTACGLREATGDAALVVNPEDVTALAGALQQVVNDDRLRRDLALRGLRHAARFRWSDTARGVLSVVDGVISVRKA